MLYDHTAMYIVEIHTLHVPLVLGIPQGLSSHYLALTTTIKFNNKVQQ